MHRSLRDEIKQTKPFSSAEQEALLSLERTAAVLVHQMAQEFEDYGVTPTQYNVLRILRGAGQPGLCRYEIRDRLVAQVPDVTRLLDRLEDAGLVERERDTADRRQVKTRITKDGLALLARMDAPVDHMQKRMLGHLGESKLRTLIALLQEVRDAEG